MYTVYANNYFKTIEFERSFLSEKSAIFTFETAMKCVDCASACIIDATTGEVLRDWEKGKLEIYK